MTKTAQIAVEGPEMSAAELTENQILRDEAEHQANRVADNIQDLAERIRLAARQFQNESIPAAAVVAEIVNTYTQSGNTVGSCFWSLIRELSRME